MDPNFLLALAGLPYIEAHPWILTLLIPSIMWVLSHFLANLPALKDTTPGWIIAIYKVLVILSANYGTMANKITVPVPTSNTVITATTTQGVK